MGRLGAESMKETADDLGFSLRQQLEWHLQGNHYPPVPKTMVNPCIEAITAILADDFDRQIELPEGVSWRGSRTAPAMAIVEAHHLETWCEGE